MTQSRLSVKHARWIVGSCLFATIVAVFCLFGMAYLFQQVVDEGVRNASNLKRCQEDRDRFQSQKEHLQELLGLSADSAEGDEVTCKNEQLTGAMDDAFGGTLQINPYLEADLQTFRSCLARKRALWREQFEPPPVVPVLPLPALPFPTKKTP